MQDRVPFQIVNRDFSLNKQDAERTQTSVSATMLFQKPLSCPPRTTPKLWELLPSSPESKGDDQPASLSGMSIADKTGKRPNIPSKRPSLEWACDNEERKAKRMRRSLPLFSGVDPSISKEAGFPIHVRRRTDCKPLHPSSRIQQSPVKKRVISFASSHIHNEGPHFDSDVLEVALTLVRMKRQSIGA